MPDFEKLYETVHRLDSLLSPAQRHPGLATWGVMVAKQWERVATSWGDAEFELSPFRWALEEIHRLSNELVMTLDGGNWPDRAKVARLREIAGTMYPTENPQEAMRKLQRPGGTKP